MKEILARPVTVAACFRAFALVLLAWVAPAIEAATFVVNDLADAVDAAPGNGVCATAGGTCTLRAAVQEANALAGADIITLPAGTYPFSLGTRGENAAASGDLDITQDLTISGAGAATTIISAASLDRVFHILTGAANVTFNQLTIADGSAGPTGLVMGAGIFNESTGTLTLTDSIVRNNVAIWYGGGISHNGAGTLNVTNTEFRQNSGYAGGGLAIIAGTATITDSLFDANAGQSGAGGIDVSAGTVLIQGTTIRNNTSLGLGGAGLSNYTGSVRILNSTISGNSRGAVRNSNTGQLTIEDTVLDANSGETISNSATTTLRRVRITATANGVGISNNSILLVEDSSITGTTPSTSAGTGLGIINQDGVADGILTMRRSTIAGNQGGGLFNASSGDAILENVTISNNSATNSGGGINNTSGSQVILRNATIVENSVTAPGSVGGGIVNFGTIQISNTILARNTSTNPGTLDCASFGTITSTGNNLVQNPGTCTFAAGDIIGADPVIGPLADNGGVTETHALLPGSPAIDAGSGCLTECQRGLPRPQDGNSDGTPVCDIGSFEIQAVPANPIPAITTIDPASVPEDGPGFTLTVNGTSFINGSVVNLNGSARPTTFVSSTQLTAAIPATDITTPSSVTITVFTGGPGGGTSNPATLTITAAAVGIPLLSGWGIAILMLALAGFGLWVLTRTT